MGTIINLKYISDKLIIRSLDFSFFSSIQLKENVTYSPYIYLTQGKSIVLSNVITDNIE